MCNSVAREIGSRCSARHVIHVSCACVSDLSSQSLTSSTSSSLSSSSLVMWVGSERIFLCASANEKSDSLVNNAPLTGYEPKFFDFSQTTEIFLQESSSGIRPSNLHYSEISDSSPLFTQEREEPAGRRQAYHSLEESLLSSQSLSVGHVRTGRPVEELSSLISSVRENLCRDSENEQIWNDKKSRLLLIVEQRLGNTSSRPIMTEEVSKN